MGVEGTGPVHILILPRCTTVPGLGSTSRTTRPGVAETLSFCPGGMPAARRPAQAAGKHDAVRAIQSYGSSHAMTMAHLWHAGKPATAQPESFLLLMNPGRWPGLV